MEGAREASLLSPQQLGLLHNMSFVKSCCVNLELEISFIPV